MDKLTKIIPTVVAIAAIVVVLYQQHKVSRLEERLEAVSASTEGEEGSAARLPPRNRELEMRVASLEQTVARVFRLLLAGKDTRAAGDAPRPKDTATKVTNLREDVDALLTGEALNTDQGRKRLHEIVRSVQQQARQERRQRRENIRQQIRKERMAKLAKDARLSTNQVERLTKMLDVERTQRRTIFRAVRDGQKPFSQAREEMRSLRTSTDQKAREILDGGQYAEYEKMRSERRGWRPRGP
jgi:hypothetical protein